MIPADLVPPDNPWPIVLGLDPGTLVAGFGALVLASDRPRLVTCGVFAPPAKLPIPQRLGRIQDELERLLEALRPHHVVVESAFTARNVKSALRIGEARGMMMATVARRGATVSELAPASVKRTIMGHGAASKEQVAAMVRRELAVADLDVPLDATDALAIALAHVHRERAAARIAPPTR